MYLTNSDDNTSCLVCVVDRFNADHSAWLNI